MTKTVFALLLLTLSIAACDPATTETNSNVKTNPSAQSSPAPVATPSLEATPAIKAALKAGDKVKVATNGSLADATVVSIDEKLGQVTVKIQGENKEKTVAIGDVKQ